MSLVPANTSGDVTLFDWKIITKVFIVRFHEGNLSVAINFFTPHSDIVQIDAIQVIRVLLIYQLLKRNENATRPNPT